MPGQQQLLDGPGVRCPPRATVTPEMVRSPVVSTSARTQRGSGSSTGAGPDQAKRRMVPAGNTATVAGLGVDHRRHCRPPGRIAHRLRPCPTRPRPDRAAPESAPTQQTSAVGQGPQPAGAASPPLPRRASAYPGIASATHFCPSRSTPNAGHGIDHRPQHVQARAGGQRGRHQHRRPPPAPAAARTAGRRATAGSPTATTPSSTTADSTAKSVVRELGYGLARSRCRRGWPGCRACPARVRREARTRRRRGAFAGGVRPARATSPAPTPSARAAPPPPRRPTSPPRRASVAGPSPGTATQTSATVAASSRPVGVSPASAIQNASPKNCRPPRLSADRSSASPSPPRAGSRSRPAGSNALAAAAQRHRDSRSPG